MQEDANAAQAEVFDRLGRKVNDVLDRLRAGERLHPPPGLFGAKYADR